jgi:pSer/pThr/pTyr-binding forkhead associated (FHA) protein
MDFASTDAWLRTLVFAGVLAGAATLAWWVMSLSSSGLRPLLAAGAALITIPAAVVAPFEGGDALAVLGLVAIVGFLGAASSAAAPLLDAFRAPATATAAPAMGAANPAAAPTPASPQTRVATYQAVTEARPAPLSQQTVALGPRGAGIPEIAFLVDYSADGHPFRLGADNRIGRDPGAEVSLQDEGASREHARIKLEDGRFVLYDLGSMNGTRLVRAGRRRKLAAPSPLSDLDVIEVGDTRLVFLSVEPPRARTTVLRSGLLDLRYGTSMYPNPGRVINTLGCAGSSSSSRRSRLRTWWML